MTSAERVYQVVRQIPAGKVLTYGEVAKRAKVTSQRLVGHLLHRNPDPAHIPCHRVVNARGELARSYAFGGKKTQALKLLNEGIKLTRDKVDLKKYRAK